MAVLRTAREENFKVFVREKITRANEWQTESHIGRLEEDIIEFINQEVQNYLSIMLALFWMKL